MPVRPRPDDEDYDSDIQETSPPPSALRNSRKRIKIDKWAEEEQSVPPVTAETTTSIQQEFFDFCRDQFNDDPFPYRVSGHKLLSYINHRKSAGRVIKTMQSGVVVVRKESLTYLVLDQIVSVILQLYRDQVEDAISKGHEGWPHPRTDEIKEALKTLKPTIPRAVSESRKIAESYSLEELQSMLAWAIDNSHRSKTFVGSIAALLLSQNLLYKADSLRYVNFSDIAYFSSYTGIMNETTPYKSPSELLMFAARNGKLNNRSLAGCLRNVNVKCCPHFWLAAYVAERFHVNNERHMHFDDMGTFANIKTLTNFNSTADPNLPMSYQYHYERHKLFMAGADVQVERSIHSVRYSGERICVDAGVSVEDIKNFGHHVKPTNDRVLEGYMNSIPVAAMAALAGATNQSGEWQYSMNRGLVEPSEALKRKLFPFINDYLDINYVLDGPGGSKVPEDVEKWLDIEEDDFREMSQEMRECHTRQKAHLVARLFDHLRVVLLEDFKFIQEAFGGETLHNIPVFQLAVFSCAEYREFRTEQDRFYDPARNADPTRELVVEQQHLLQQLLREQFDQQQRELEQQLQLQQARLHQQEEVDIEQNQEPEENLQQQFQRPMQPRPRPIYPHPHPRPRPQQQQSQSQPIRVQVVQSQPVQSQPIRVQVVQSQPVQSQPVQSQPVQSQPVQSQPVQSQPVQSQPVQSQPIRVQVVQSQPAQSQPVQPQPAEPQLVDLHLQPVNSQPVHSQPVHSQPVLSQPQPQPQPQLPHPVQPHPQLLQTYSQHPHPHPEITSAMNYVCHLFNQFKADMDQMYSKIETKMDYLDAKVEDIHTSVSRKREGTFSPNTSYPSSPEQNSSPQANGTAAHFQFVKSPLSFEPIWREYKYPTDGRPSIEQLEKQYGNEWRKDAEIGRKFTRRSIIYKAVLTGLSKGMTEEECLRLLNSARAKHGVSVTTFMQKKTYIPEVLRNGD